MAAVPVEVAPGPAAATLSARLPWLALIWFSAAAVVLVAMAEVSRLSGSVLDTRSQAWAFGELMGPSAWPSRSGWTAAFGPESVRPAALRIYLGLDLAFIGLYALALGRIISRRYRDELRIGLIGLLGALVVVDLLEDGMASRTGQPVSLDVAQTLAVVSSVKCGLGLVMVVAGAYGVLTWNGNPLKTNLRTIYEVLRKHRLSLVPLLVLAVVAVAPGAEILDQVPDIERRWADGPHNLGVEGLSGLAALLLMAAALLLLGRVRTHLIARNTPATRAANRARFPLGLWLLGPLVLLVSAAVFESVGSPVAWSRVLLFCAVPVLIWGASVFYRSRPPREPPRWRPFAPTPWEVADLGLLLRVGDGLALAVLLVGALGAVRSMTAVVVLQSFGLIPANGLAWLVFWSGALGAPAVWVVSALVYRGLGAALQHGPRSWWGVVATWLTPRPGQQDPPMIRVFPVLSLVAALALFAALGMRPALVGQLGVLAVFVLCLLALTGIVAAAGVIAQRYRPAEVFLRLHLRSTPVLALLLAAVLFAGAVGSGTPIHAVRSQTTAPAAAAAAGATDPRPDLDTTIRRWASDHAEAGCGRTVTVGSSSVEVLPMVMIAAEGGGIRAAYWTVQAVQPLSEDRCASRSTVFSSGVSGGAVGLAVARFNANPTDVVKEMSNSRALSYGLVGLFVRDFAYAATGIPLPDLDRSDRVAWVDRAGLMEDAWNVAGAAPDSWQDRPLVGAAEPGRTLHPSVGPVILNSMSVGNACRVWVSEIRLRPVDEVVDNGDGKISCEQTGVPGLRSVDLLSAYGASATDPADESGVTDGGGGGHDGCLHGMTASTAAMLAARFPYVTPSGRVGSCARPGLPTTPVDQLADGGYLENTGLGTINDLSDTWLPAVQAWNAEHAGGSRPQVIVPMVVYLSNDSGVDQRAPQRDLTGEALLPALAKLRAGGGAVSDDTTLQRSADLVRPDRVCPSSDARCRAAVSSVPQRVFLVYPGSKPQIAAPLGWILSESSRTSMDEALAYQAETSCQEPDRSVQVRVVCDRGYGTFRDLRSALGS